VRRFFEVYEIVVPALVVPAWCCALGYLLGHLVFRFVLKVLP
jgi:hypothetical protein